MDLSIVKFFCVNISKALLPNITKKMYNTQNLTKKSGSILRDRGMFAILYAIKSSASKKQKEGSL